MEMTAPGRVTAGALRTLLFPFPSQGISADISDTLSQAGKTSLCHWTSCPAVEGHLLVSHPRPQVVGPLYMPLALTFLQRHGRLRSYRNDQQGIHVKAGQTLGDMAHRRLQGTTVGKRVHVCLHLGREMPPTQALLKRYAWIPGPESRLFLPFLPPPDHKSPLKVEEAGGKLQIVPEFPGSL